MPDYRRNRVPGGTYFFTVCLQDRQSDTLVTEINTLRATVRHVKARLPFHIDAFVELPDHLHCVWTLPPGDPDFSLRWQSIKAGFSRALPSQPGGRSVWQRRFWEHTTRDERDYAAHLDYTLFNPVKHGLVANPADWPHSTFHRSVVAGLYPAGWATSSPDIGPAGER